MARAGEVNHLAPERVWQEIQRALNEAEPVTFFTVLRDCGALESLIPEFGPDSSSRNIFSRAMAALECAHSHNLKTEARFAALLSPLAHTGQHAGENRAQRRAKKLRAPNDCIALARLVAEFAQTLDADHPVTPDLALALLTAADAWRRPERFATLLATLSCVLEPGPASKVEQLRRALAAANTVSPQLLMAEGFSGKALGEAIHSERLRRIQESFPEQ